MQSAASDGNGNGAATLVVERGDVERLAVKLIASNADERSRMRGLDDQRRDQILAGVVLVEALMKRCKIKRIHMCGSALREGILLDYLSRHIPDLAIRRDVPDPRRRSVLDLARRCDWHRTHSEHVAMLCMRLFDELRGLHGMGQIERELIEYAAFLHDIGWHIAGKGHHKHSMYLILNGDLKNFTEEEVGIIAKIARYHRKTTPKPKHQAYKQLHPESRRVVDAGAAMLRLADGLDRSHANAITDLRCEVGRRKVRCRLMTRADAELEIWGARRKMDWFRKVFSREIDFNLAKR